jgi:hypothetical protein
MSLPFNDPKERHWRVLVPRIAVSDSASGKVQINPNAFLPTKDDDGLLSVHRSLVMPDPCDAAKALQAASKTPLIPRKILGVAQVTTEEVLSINLLLTPFNDTLSHTGIDYRPIVEEKWEDLASDLTRCAQAHGLAWQPQPGQSLV